MLTPTDISNLYKKYNVKASKRFGQNFLVDQNILKKIINVVDINDKDVVEIGPGLGSLTLHLLEKAKTVTSYEIDEDMIKVLKSEITDDKFNLIEGDFLKAELNFENPIRLIANIPYNITSDILFKIFQSSNKIEKAVIMMQKEVAERLVAPVGSKNYGKLTISTNHFANIKYEFTVPEGAFIPAPKVKSAIVSFEFKNTNYEESEDFLKFVKNCFSMRRKTLYNNLKNIYGPEKSKEIIENNNLKESIRPQELSYETFLNIYKTL